jgi:hypothetical protein
VYLTEILLANAPLAVSVEGSARTSVVGLAASLGLAVGIVLVSAWWRRRSRANDPFRSLEPPMGPLRFARGPKIRPTTD